MSRTTSLHIQLRSVLLFTGFLALAMGCFPRPDYLCQKDLGCPAQRAMPKCPAGLATESLETAVAQAGERIGQSVTVRSRLWRQGTITTLLHCGHGDCCNSVGGGFILASRSLGLEEESQGFYIQPRKVAPHYGCYGDETLLCCDLEGRGQEVIAQGVITGSPSSGLGNGYALADAKFCIP